MKMSRTVRDVSVGVAIVVVLLAGFFLFKREMARRLDALAQLKAQASSLDAAPTDTGALHKDVEALQSQIKAFAEQTPYQPDISVLLADLGGQLPEETAGEREIVMKPTVGGARLNRNPVVLRMRGSGETTLSLLRRIESYRFLTRVARVYMEKRNPESDQPPMVEIEFTLFSRSAPEALSWDQ